MEHALAINEKINGLDYSSLADQLYALAVLMIDAGRPCDALEYANRAASMLSIASIRKTPGKLHLVSFHMTNFFSEHHYPYFTCRICSHSKHLG